MIESNIIKRYIVKSFMQNSECDISKIADITFNTLSSRFLVNENVILPSLDTSGKILKCSKESYLVQLSDESKTELPFKEIKRKSSFDYNDIYGFLECITSVTPFGRIVIENVFEKITQPGFGANYKRAEPEFDKSNLKGLQRRPEKSARPSVFQSVEIKNQISKSSRRVEEQEPKLDITSFKKLAVSGFEGKNLSVLLKLYTFLTAFKYDARVGSIVNPEEIAIPGKIRSNESGTPNLEKFAEMLADSDYSSSTIMEIHRFFIEAIERDISTSGYRYTNELFLCISRLPEFAAEPIKDQKRKRVTFDKENWKLQTKNFILNLSVELGSDKLLRFVDFSKKECFDLKIEFLDFLYKIFTYTDTFKTLTYNAVNTTRMNKAMGEPGKKEAQEEDSGTQEQQTYILDNPLMANIGRFKSGTLFLSDRKIILSDNYQYYILDQKEANMVLRELNILSKTEKSTITNLRAIIGELFNSK